MKNTSTATTQVGFNITAEELEEWRAFEANGSDEDCKRARTYRKSCKKQNIHPTPPSQWMVCEVCGYKTPGSLVSHYTAKHGGVNNVARMLGKLPEEIAVVSVEMSERFKQYGARSKDALAAKKAMVA